MGETTTTTTTKAADTTTTTTKVADTTTTTTEPVEDTTTTTTQAPEAAPQPKGDNASINHPGGDASPMAERQGEVAIDKGVKTDVVGGFGGAADPEKDAEVQSQNVENAKQDALRNAKRERGQQPERDEDRDTRR